ncbi:MAG: hypothetical protein LBO82_04220 [Synergistaceae bacterium]|jgi:hypothetical protein|nr:hypothetical protein [Synergistaceae bacterium]
MMEERIMTDAQFRAIIDFVIAMLKKSTAEEALEELKIIREGFGKKRPDTENND